MPGNLGPRKAGPPLQRDPRTGPEPKSFEPDNFLTDSAGGFFYSLHMPSVKANFAWSTVLTVAGYVFPLLTFPYVTRVLGVEGLGITQFAESVVSYFSLFAMLGIGTVGVREIAKAKATGSKEALSNVYSSLLFLNLIATSIAIFILCY